MDINQLFFITSKQMKVSDYTNHQLTTREKYMFNALRFRYELFVTLSDQDIITLQQNPVYTLATLISHCTGDQDTKQWLLDHANYQDVLYELYVKYNIVLSNESIATFSSIDIESVFNILMDTYKAIEQRKITNKKNKESQLKLKLDFDENVFIKNLSINRQSLKETKQIPIQVLKLRLEFIEQTIQSVTIEIRALKKLKDTPQGLKKKDQKTLDRMIRQRELFRQEREKILKAMNQMGNNESEIKTEIKTEIKEERKEKKEKKIKPIQSQEELKQAPIRSQEELEQAEQLRLQNKAIQEQEILKQKMEKKKEKEQKKLQNKAIKEQELIKQKMEKKIVKKQEKEQRKLVKENKIIQIETGELLLNVDLETGDVGDTSNYSRRLLQTMPTEILLKRIKEIDDEISNLDKEILLTNDDDKIKEISDKSYQLTEEDGRLDDIITKQNFEILSNLSLILKKAQWNIEWILSHADQITNIINEIFVMTTGNANEVIQAINVVIEFVKEEINKINTVILNLPTLNNYNPSKFQYPIVLEILNRNQLNIELLFSNLYRNDKNKDSKYEENINLAIKSLLANNLLLTKIYDDIELKPDFKMLLESSKNDPVRYDDDYEEPVIVEEETNEPIVEEEEETATDKIRHLLYSLYEGVEDSAVLHFEDGDLYYDEDDILFKSSAQELEKTFNGSDDDEINLGLDEEELAKKTEAELKEKSKKRLKYVRSEIKKTNGDDDEEKQTDSQLYKVPTSAFAQANEEAGYELEEREEQKKLLEQKHIERLRKWASYANPEEVDKFEVLSKELEKKSLPVANGDFINVADQKILGNIKQGDFPGRGIRVDVTTGNIYPDNQGTMKKGYVFIINKNNTQGQKIRIISVYNPIGWTKKSVRIKRGTLIGPIASLKAGENVIEAKSSIDKSTPESIGLLQANISGFLYFKSLPYSTKTNQTHEVSVLIEKKKKQNKTTLELIVPPIGENNNNAVTTTVTPTITETINNTNMEIDSGVAGLQETVVPAPVITGLHGTVVRAGEVRKIIVPMTIT